MEGLPPILLCTPPDVINLQTIKHEAVMLHIRIPW